MKETLILAIIILLFAQNAQSQENNFHLEVETQWYPAGFQFMAATEYNWSSKDAIHLKFGYNLARRQDFSPFNELENGGGLGFTLGYRRYFKEEATGFYLGGRFDIWWLTIDWEDDNATRMGTTDITVFQPTFEIGYLYQFDEMPLAIGANLSNGYEINVQTKGDAVGEGFITLIGIRLRYEL
ncbi:MAG: hypothetical protein ACPG19_01905 [Saprospiraceae bacterium]